MLRPTVLVLDVNETLSDMSPLAGRLEEIGAPGHLMQTWFAGTLRDGIALTAAGGYADFTAVAGATLLSLLAAEDGLSEDPAQAAEFVVAGLSELPLHPDVRKGLEGLHAAGFRLVTLTNGSAENTESLLERGGVLDLVELRLSVDDVGRWKPAPEPYAYALARCGIGPSEAMLVAAHPWDLNGAKRAGLGAAWVNRLALPYPKVLAAPDLECADFEVLAQALTG